MRLTWSLIALVLIAAGGVALMTVSREQQGRTGSVQVCRERMSSTQDRYFAALSEWRALSWEQQLHQPWPQVVQELNLPDEFVERHQLITLTAELPELAAGQIKLSPFANTLYGKDYREQINVYRRQKERAATIVRFAVIGIAVGGLVLIVTVCTWVVSKLGKKPVATGTGKAGQVPMLKAVPTVKPDPAAPRELPELSKSYDPRRDVDIDERWTTEKDEALKAQKEVWARAQSLAAKAKGVPRESDTVEGPKPAVTIDTGAQQAAATLVSEAIGAGTPAMPTDTEELKKLTQELTALREYASSQQDRMRKLQDGYDWTILKNFCLRIIRCVDHLDFRIAELQQMGDAPDDLEEVRDELIFAMESSGVEQYRPDVHLPYRGNERELEVVPHRIDCNEPEMIDTVAEIVRPGYQYVVDENNIKIVRTAQVRLYGLGVAETVS